MTSSQPTLRADLDHALDTSKYHFWGGIIAVVVSFVLPLVGVVAAYSGYQLTQVMWRRWLGLLIAVFGALNFVAWIGILIFAPELLVPA